MTEGFALHEIITDEMGRTCDYRFLDVNPAFERLTGLSRPGIVGRRVREVLPDIEPSWIETYGRVALTGEPIAFERYYPAPLNRWYEIRAFRPGPRQFAVVFIDITLRKRTEEALLESERRLERSQAIAHLGSWELDRSADRLTWSDEVYRIFGLLPRNSTRPTTAFWPPSIRTIARPSTKPTGPPCATGATTTRSNTGSSGGTPGGPDRPREMRAFPGRLRPGRPLHRDGPRHHGAQAWRVPAPGAGRAGASPPRGGRRAGLGSGRHGRPGRPRPLRQRRVRDDQRQKQGRRRGRELFRSRRRRPAPGRNEDRRGPGEAWHGRMARRRPGDRRGRTRGHHLGGEGPVGGSDRRSHHGARRHPGSSPPGAGPSSPKNGGAGDAGRRHRPRFQQYPAPDHDQHRAGPERGEGRCPGGPPPEPGPGCGPARQGHGQAESSPSRSNENRTASP
ncbi:MAG: PAS domain S-box protein [Sphingobacterium sp.]|nr:PAS domain S-box protein [Sphingobacterium sp.]